MAGFGKGFGRQSRTVPPVSPDEETQVRPDLPSTLRLVRDKHVVQHPVFDPALKQYPNAYRAAEPRFTDPDVERAWHEARRTAIDLVLSAIADSSWANSLVLRGSVLLRAWFGNAAREPGDLDFVVTPASWRIDEERTDSMLTGLARAAETLSHRSDSTVRIDAAKAAGDDIWTYDRVPGRRLVLPLSSDGPSGFVQLDFVFNEHLPVAPEPVLLPSATGGPGALLNAATAELSLAWKLMWLMCDAYPQGKDLYDAVLLAEHTPLRYELLRQVFLGAAPSDGCRPVGQREIAALKHSVEWDHFVAEYPDVTESEDDFVDRLGAALAPTFSAVEPAGQKEAGQQEGEYARHVRWLEPRIQEYQELLHRTSMRAVQERMHKDGLPPIAAIVITRELLGPGRHSLEDARDAVFDDPAWHQLAGIHRRNGDWLDRELERL